MTMPTPGWRPLPDCPGCDRPVKRATAQHNGGYCTTCRPKGASPVQALPEGERINVREWQQLAASRGAQERRQAAERAARRSSRGK